MQARDWRDNVAIVTGGTSGIGRAVALALAARGCSVVVVGRNAERLETALRQAREAGAPRARGMLLDVCNADDMQHMADETERAFGRLDALVASAGVGGSAGPGELPPMVLQLAAGEWDEVVDTNLRGTFLSNRAALGIMLRQRRGEIVNVVSSRGAARGQPFAAAYCASKRAVLGLTATLAEEVESRGVRVQAVLPDATDTPLLHKARHLAREGILPAERVAGLIVDMMELPADLRWSAPVAAPMPAAAEAGRPLFS